MLTTLRKAEYAELVILFFIHGAAMSMWFVPLSTVLDANGHVIEEDQRHLFRHLAQQGRGADILFGVGTTGEWNRIDNSERQRLIWIETDEVARINSDASTRGQQPVEAWVGVTAPTGPRRCAAFRSPRRCRQK